MPPPSISFDQVSLNAKHRSSGQMLEERREKTLDYEAVLLVSIIGYDLR